MATSVLFFSFCFLLAYGSAFLDLQSSVKSSVPYYSTSFAAFSSMSTSRDILVAPDVFNNLSVYIRSNDGFYNVASTIPIESTSYVVSTNGDWVSIVIPGEEHRLFRLNVDGSIASKQPTILQLDSVVAKLMEDDSYVVVLNSTIATYQYNMEINNWTLFRQDSFSDFTFAGLTTPSNYYGLTETTLLSVHLPTIGDNTTIRLFSRQLDGSWILESFLFINSTELLQGSLVFSFFWDGDNTLLFGNGVSSDDEQNNLPLGSLYIFTKKNNVWKEFQRITAQQLSIGGVAYFGTPIYPLDIYKDNYIVGAYLDNPTGSSIEPGGSAFYLRRNSSGEFNALVRIVPNQRSGSFAHEITGNELDIIISDCQFPQNLAFICHITTLPRCFDSPVNVTCHPQQLSSCDPSKIDVSNLYTVNNPSCGETTAQIAGLRPSDSDGLEVDLIFSRNGVANGQCSFRISCPIDGTPSPTSTAPSSPSGSSTSSSTSLAEDILHLTTLLLSLIYINVSSLTL